MAVLTTTEIWEGRSGRVNRTGVREYSRAYRVTTDTFADDATVAANAQDPVTSLAVPAIGDSFGTNDANAICVSVKPTQQASDPRVWVVSVDYTSDPGGATATQPENPLQRAAVESLSFNKITRPLPIDQDGKAIRNSAGDMYDPLPEVEVARPVLKIQRNEGAFAYSTAVDYVGTINDATFRGAPAGQARMIEISATQQFENGISFFSVNYAIEFWRQEIDGTAYGWDLAIPDRGFRVLVGGVPTLKPPEAQDAAGNTLGASPNPEAIFLDGSGGELATNGTIVINQFRAYERKDFGALNL